jgi:hypothetical protein
VSDEDTKTDKAETDDPSTKFEMFVRGLSDTQLAAAKATVDSVAGERNGPDVTTMSEGEFEEWKRKILRKGQA